MVDMEPHTASVYSSGSVPRLRVTRRPSSAASSDLPPLRWSSEPRHSLSHPDSQTTSEDESGTLDLAGATPRLLSASLPPPDSTAGSADTAHRLRAVLSRFDTPSRTPASSSRGAMPPSPSEPESDFDPPPAQAARASIKVLLQNALREPGDTPQKPKLTRRASFNAVESPKVSKSRRKSTSDEENETLTKHYEEGRSELSTAASLDRLRLQLTESMLSIPAASSSSSTSRPPSEVNISNPKRANSSHHNRVSKIPVSNSPVRHAKSHQDLEPFAVASTGTDSALFSSHGDHVSSYAPRVMVQASHQHSPHENGSASVTRHRHDSAPNGSSPWSSAQPDAVHRESLRASKHETDAVDWDRRNPLPRIRTSSGPLHASTNKATGRISPGAWPTPPPPGTSPSSSRSPRQSLTRRESDLADGRSEDGRSSRGTSASSNAEYRERMKEAEQERQEELERGWNRPRPQHSQSVPHLHVQESHMHGHPLRTESPAEHSRPRSRVGHEPAQTISPPSSHSHEEDSEEHEVEHERERNWNAPRPKWGQHPHHSHEGDHHHAARSFSPIPPQPGTSQDHTVANSRHRTGSSASHGVSGDGQSHSRPHSRLQHDPSHPHSRLDDKTFPLRTGSPASSTSSLSHQDEEVEELHERERNWNAPRPKWGQYEHVHHGTPGYETDHHLSSNASSHSLRHSGSIDREREHDWGHSRPNSSLGIPVEARRTRSPSPTLNARLQAGKIGHSKSPIPPTHASGARHPRPKSPLPPLNGKKDKVKDVDVDVDHGKAWSSPKVSPSHRHNRTPSSPSPAPSQPESRASDPISLTQSFSARRPTSPGRTPTPEPVAASDIKRGHRRTTTELSEAMGPFPRKTTLPPSVAMPNEESDGSLFADESVPPPQMSTPTFRRGHLPDLSLSSDASDIPLPPSPPSSGDLATRADSDLARLQRAVTPNFTFPARQPSPPETPVLSTPPRRSSLNAQQLEFKTPSPPLGLPDLPDPPSFDEEAKTPGRVNERVESPQASLSRMKTPRFPGAFGTPAPPPSGPAVAENDSSDELEATPKLVPVDATAQSQTLDHNINDGTPGPISVPVTPAPPGAYRPTPSASKRKGILKVRFDGDVQNAEFIDGTGNTVNGVVSTTKVLSPPPSPSSEDIPPLSLSPMRRKGLRLVDEYGRARRFTESGEEIILDSRRKMEAVTESPTRTSPPKPPPVDDVTMTPRRRVKMRQVDALGNEVTEEQRPVNGEARGSRKAVFSRLTRSLGELRDELAGEEEALAASLPQIGPRDNERLMDLAVLSKTARVERNKLTRKLQLERHAEGGVTSEVYAARDPPPVDTSTRAPWWRRKWRLALSLLILELFVFCVGYRLASIHAKQAWLATHYDPFFPALYLRKSPPSFVSRFGTLPAGWSAFAISGAVQRVGVRGFVEGVGKQLWEGVWNWKMEPWETWGSPATGPPVPQPWPPS